MLVEYYSFIFILLNRSLTLNWSRDGREKFTLYHCHAYAIKTEHVFYIKKITHWILFLRSISFRKIISQEKIEQIFPLYYFDFAVT